MTHAYRIEWDGPASPDHENLLRETIAQLADSVGILSFPRGCSYLRVPLVPGDECGPGIDCHWDNYRNALICFMDLVDGPLPEELQNIPELNDEPIDLFGPWPRMPRKH